MHLTIRVVILAGAVALAGCEARIDGTDAERAGRSINKVRDSVPAARRAEFDKSLDIVMRHGAEPPLLADARVRKEIDGKSAAEIIAAADRVVKEDAQRKLDEKAQAEIAALHASFDRIDAGDPKAQRLVVDDDVRAFCHQPIGGTPRSPADVDRCERVHMNAKKKVMAASAEIRSKCPPGFFGGWVDQADCVDREQKAKADLAKMMDAAAQRH